MFFSMEMFWIIVFVVSVVVEIITVGLTTIWFALGALVAFVASLLGAGFGLQIILFMITTLVSLLWTRPIAVKYLNSKRIRTNIEEIMGSRVKVIERIDNFDGTGKVNYNGMEWTARSVRDEECFEVGDYAIVHSVEGVKLIVESEEKAAGYVNDELTETQISNDVVLTAEENV